MRAPRALPLLIALAFTAGADAAYGYPIPPRPLWEEVEEATLVVLAKVEKTREIPRAQRKENLWGDTVAVLKVLETWKGEAQKAVEVEFPFGLICPAPPRYVKGKEVVAFLERSTGTWRTVGLSYGTLYPARDEVHDLREMVLRALELQRHGKVPQAEYLDWLVEAASRPATRWHGLYPLMPGSDEMHSYYDRTGRKPLAQQLQPEHLARIAEGFVSSPPVDRTLTMAMSVLSKHKSRRVDEAAASVIEALFLEPSLPWITEEALKAVLRRFGDRQPERRLVRLEKLRKQCTEVNRNDSAELAVLEEAQRVWSKAKADLGIPDVPPAPVPGREVWGTGENTPS